MSTSLSIARWGLLPGSLCRAVAVVLGLLVAVQGTSFAKAPSTNVAWQPAAADADIDRAFAQARAQKKPVLLYWGATWCPPCNQLKATLFNRQDFALASKSFVAVHVDGDRPGAQRLGSRFKVSGYPTVVLFSPDGAEITRLPGEADADQVMAVLQLGMAGGRPIKSVLADARAKASLSAAEWRMLAFYSWATDEQQLIAKGELAAVMAELALASPSAQPDITTRLWLKALAASDDGKGIKPDASLRDRVQRVLTDPAAARLHMDVVAGDAANIVRALSDEESSERAALVPAYEAALQRLEADASLSRGDRMGALISRIALARLGVPRDKVQLELPEALRQDVRTQVARDDREIVDGYERQAVITAAAYALGYAGLWEESNALLKSNVARSHSPYYLMSQLGGNARKLGKKDEALSWYQQAWSRSEGPATRLQWGSSYLVALVDLAPKDIKRIESTAASLIAEAAKDSGAFEGRSVRSLQRISKKLDGWKAGGGEDAAKGRLRAQLGGVCAKLGASPQRATCQDLLKVPTPSV